MFAEHGYILLPCACCGSMVGSAGTFVRIEGVESLVYVRNIVESMDDISYRNGGTFS